MVQQIATGLIEWAQPAGQRRANAASLPYAGVFCTCFRASRRSTITGRSSHNNTKQSASASGLARLCTQAVLTVQTVFVVEPPQNTQSATTPWYDSAYEHPPAVTTVEAPPLAWYAEVQKTGGNSTANAKSAMTATEGWATWQATWPWRRSVVYGANIRMRTSPGLVVDTADDDDDDVKHNDATAHTLPKQGGMTGPVVAAPESTCLWTLTSLDPFTTLAIDLALEEHQPMEPTSTSPYPDDAVKPRPGMLQVCVAYTALEADEDGRVWTVRRIKVAHRLLQRAPTVESLYRRVDPEALAVVLLHKLVRCAAAERLSIGQEWLEAFLVAVYESALEEQERQEDLKRHGIADEEGYFLPAERLLSLSMAGELSTTDVLLAQGHGRLRPIALLLFLLLQQCQSKITDSSTTPSYQCQWNRSGLSLSDLVRMSPDSLSRCLAPRLQLWSNDSVLVDLIDLRHETVVHTIREETALLKNPRDSLLLVLDAPDQIIVANARAFLPGSKEPLDKLPPQLGPNLQSTLKDMVASYPTPPPTIYGGGSSWLTDVCREDLPLGDASNFDAWRVHIAKTVHKELVRRKCIENDTNGTTDGALEV